MSLEANTFVVRYERYFRRFKSIFPLDTSIPQYFIPGNHDTGYVNHLALLLSANIHSLGVSDQFSEKAAARYESHFGPLNSRVTIANHTIILLDAPGLVEEEAQRPGRYDGKPVPGGSIELVQSFAKRTPSSPLYFGHTKEYITVQDENPVVLFTHIPLSRPDGSSCGPNRERGTIRRGAGFGYQNTLGKSASNFLLESLRPSVIFRFAEN
jgi:hypothetical protein